MPSPAELRPTPVLKDPPSALRATRLLYFGPLSHPCFEGPQDPRTCLSRGVCLARARTSQRRQAYACLLEKAYAKAHGSYGGICGGGAAEALQDLTGAPVEEVRLEEGAGVAELWSLLQRRDAEGDPARRLRRFVLLLVVLVVL